MNERQVVANVTEKFFNHFLQLSTTDRQQLVAAVPAAAFDVDSKGNLTLTDAQAKTYATTLRAKDAELAVIDTRVYTPKETLLLYASFISLSGYINNAAVTVDPAQITIKGDNATVPGSALTYLINGETQTGATQSASGTLHRVNGTWLIAPTIKK